MRVGNEQPFLFFPEGLDVRWRSFATVAEQAAGGRRALEGLGLHQASAPSPGEPGAVAYAWVGGLHGADAVAADLAIRSGGWTAAPVPAPADLSGASPLRPPEHAARLLLPWEAGSTAGRVADQAADGAERGDSGPLVAHLPSAARELGRRPGPHPSGGSSGDLPPCPGGALIREAASGAEEPGGGWCFVSSEALREAAEDLGRALGAGRSAGRAVVVAWLDPSLAEGRVLLEWAITTRAALYLESDRRVLGGAAAWVRPTVVAGDALALAAVAAKMRRPDTRRSRLARRLLGSAPRPPFGRLRWAVILGADDLADEDRALFDASGVVLVRPRLGAGQPG